MRTTESTLTLLCCLTLFFVHLSTVSSNEFHFQRLKQDNFLVVNVFITESRFTAYPNRFSRLDVFLQTLRSFDRMNISWTEVHLKVSLDRRYKNCSHLIDLQFQSLFQNVRIKSVSYSRLEEQDEWKSFLSSICNHGDEIIFIATNDDHMFIDIDDSLIQEGVDILTADKSKFKGLALSHWPEAVANAKNHNGTLFGNWIHFFGTDFNTGLLMWNCRWVWHVVAGFDWKGLRFPRLEIYGALPEYLKYDVAEFHASLYVPLREILRHLDSYSHIMPASKMEPFFPKLELDDNVDRTLFNKTLQELESLLSLVAGPLDQTWVNQSIFLYSKEPKNLVLPPTRYSAAACS